MQYIKTIAAFLIIVNLLQILINNDSYKKYMKIFSGLILILMIVKPVHDIFSSGMMEKTIDKKMQEYEIAEINNSLNNINNDIGERAKNIYEEKIAGDISEFLAKQEIQVKNVEVEMRIDETELKFQKVSIELDEKKNMTLTGDENNIYEVGEINGNRASEVRIEYINSLISKEYGIERGLIYISD